MKYTIPMIWPINEDSEVAQYPCWSGGIAYGGQCANGGTAGTSCYTGYGPFSS
jgi:hypothetical protein